jgi:hypothetical protein
VCLNKRKEVFCFLPEKLSKATFWAQTGETGLTGLDESHLDLFEVLHTHLLFHLLNVRNQWYNNVKNLVPLNALCAAVMT